MDHWVAAPTAKLGELSLTARTHVVEQETPLLQSSSDFHVHTTACVHTGTHTCVPAHVHLKCFIFLNLFPKQWIKHCKAKLKRKMFAGRHTRHRFETYMEQRVTVREVPMEPQT